MANRARRVALGVTGAAIVLAMLPSTPVRAATPNVFTEYHVPTPNGSSGEPSIGYDTARHAAMYGAGLNVERLTWNDAAAGSPMTSVDKTALANSVTTLDSITFVDQHTNRTFQADLAAAASVISYSDDAGDNYKQSTGFPPGALLDHESVGGGPFHAPIPGNVNPVYPDAVYYCAQNSFNGACAASYTGGATFNNGVPAYNAGVATDPGDSNTTFSAEGGACSALHGHVRVSADGTAYLPVKGCGGSLTTCNLTNTEFAGGTPSLSISTDNGVSWQVHRQVFADGKDHNTDESDPSVDTTPNNTAWFGWEDGANPNCTTSASHTTAQISAYNPTTGTYSTPTDVSTPAGLNNVMFPEVIAGDNGRVAFAFLGTTGIGDDQQNGFVGTWYLYVATTYDNGASWTTVNATPNDPVQRGCIDLQGIAPGSPKNNVCSHRNLLDFNDITVDDHGRVLVAYAKGCTGACVNDPTSTTADDQDYVARLTSGEGLYAKFDSVLGGPGTDVPEAQRVLLLPLAAAAVGGALLLGNRRRRGARSGTSAG